MGTKGVPFGYLEFSHAFGGNHAPARAPAPGPGPGSGSHTHALQWLERITAVVPVWNSCNGSDRNRRNRSFNKFVGPFPPIVSQERYK